jgi:hypothetical protein
MPGHVKRKPLPNEPFRPQHKLFAEMLPKFFSTPELAWIYGQTSLGPSALDIVRAAVRRSKKDFGGWARMPPSEEERADVSE